MEAKILEIKVADDHLQKIFKNIKDPSKGVAELVWNSLDADATEVDIELTLNAIGGVETIIIKDNGHGIMEDDLDVAFGYIGRSQKPVKSRSPGGRSFHGSGGQGRYFGFSLGRSIEWQSSFHKDSAYFAFTIQGDGNKLTNFPVSKIEEVTTKNTGVTVIINNLTKVGQKLTKESLEEDLITVFAYYLRAYQKSQIKISVNGNIIDPNKAILDSYERKFTITKPSTKEQIEFNLIIYHWKNPGIKRRFFCGPQGTVIRDDFKTGVSAKDFGHSIHLASSYFDEISEQNTTELLENDEIYPDLEENMATDLNRFLRRRLADRAQSALADLKKSNVYPYKNLPSTPVEKAEREIFDIYASQILVSPHNLLGQTQQSKTLVLNLLKDAMESDPASILPIFQQVLDLPKDELETLVDLVKKYSLSTVIKLSRLVANRMAFISELRYLLFDQDYKKRVLERRHLHKILENELWVFGDQYALGTSDKGLGQVLKTHIKLLGRDSLNLEIDSSDLTTIPDLFLYKMRPEGEGKSEHLIIELKRPNLTLGRDELNQIKDYASSVSNCQDFDKNKVRWKFILIGNAIDDYVRNECNQAGRGKGIASKPESGNYEVNVFTWGEILQDLSTNYAFIKAKIDEFEESPEEMQYLRENYARFLPKQQD
jgi:hypothetical protein